MTSKPETILLQIKELENQDHSKYFLEFYDWLTDEEDSSIRNATNYMMILKLFSAAMTKKDLKNVTKGDVLDFLDKRKKSAETDPDQK